MRSRFFGRLFASYAVLVVANALLVEFLISLEDLETFIKFLKVACEPQIPIDTAVARFYDLPGKTALENRWIAWLEYSARRP